MSTLRSRLFWLLSSAFMLGSLHADLGHQWWTAAIAGVVYGAFLPSLTKWVKQ